MTTAKDWLYAVAAAFIAVSSPVAAQELEREGAFAPTGDDYIIELREFDRFLVGEKVGDGDDIGELHRIRVELSTNADRHYSTQSRSSVRVQKHSLIQRTGYWPIQPFHQISRFRHDEVLSVHAPPASKIDIDIIARERDCAGRRSCNRGDSGRTFMYFEVPTFAVSLPRECTIANTFKLQTIDNRWHFGPVPMGQGEAGRGGPYLTFDPAYPPSICIRKPGGPPDISAVLYNQANGACLSHQPNPDTGFKALRLGTCGSARQLFERALDRQADGSAYLQNLKKKNSFFVSDGPVTFERNRSTCLFAHHARFQPDVFSRTAAPSNYCALRSAEQMLWEHGKAHAESISNSMGQCLSIGSPTARSLSLETCRDRSEQRWKLAVPYRLFAPWARNVTYGHHEFRPS